MKSQLIQSAARLGAPESSPDDSRNGQVPCWLRVKPVYTLQDFCRDFGICRSLAYEEIRGRRLRAYKIGASTRIAGEDALAWRESYRTIKAA